ncbi:MAG: folylpolyglutamate synthase/dihydrofolate synthase family protein [Calditrichaceae bacterium]
MNKTPYSTTIEELYDLQKFAIKLGLENIKAICDFLSNPHLDYPVIHIAGTNGKGSTSYFTASFLQAMGLKVGLFTSPHLVDFRERIRINGIKIEKKFIIDFWDKTKELVLKRQATFFDTTTALAFEYFRFKQVDVAVIETGLGGRLDSTNLVNSEIAVLTPIDFDHEKQLGNTLKEIVFEKTGIIKDKAFVFSGEQHDETFHYIEERLKPSNKFFALKNHVTCEIKDISLDGTTFDLSDKLNQERFGNLNTRQVGNFQLNNIALAYLVSRNFLSSRNINFSEKIFRDSLASSIWEGRLQVMQKQPRIIFDVSHNRDGIKRTIDFIMDFVAPEKFLLLLGLVRDKQFEDIVKYLSGKARLIVVTEPETDRKLDGDTLFNLFKQNHQNAYFIKDLHKAFEFSKKQQQADDILLVAGSHYLIGPYLNKFNLT